MAGCGALNCIVGSLRLPVVGRLGRLLCLSLCLLLVAAHVRSLRNPNIYLPGVFKRIRWRRRAQASERERERVVR